MTVTVTEAGPPPHARTALNAENGPALVNGTLMEELPIRCGNDVVQVRQHARAAAAGCGLSLVDQTKLLTAASELARGTLVHGGGTARIEAVRSGNGRTGIRIGFAASRPGAGGTEPALNDGQGSGNGPGADLSGAFRLVDEFELAPEPGAGTTVAITKWSR